MLEPLLLTRGTLTVNDMLNKTDLGAMVELILFVRRMRRVVSLACCTMLTGWPHCSTAAAAARTGTMQLAWALMLPLRPIQLGCTHRSALLPSFVALSHCVACYYSSGLSATSQWYIASTPSSWMKRRLQT